MKLLILVFIILIYAGCNSKIKWTDEEYKTVFLQNLNLVKIYTSNEKSNIALSKDPNDKQLEWSKCITNNLMKQYSFKEYFNASSTGENDKRVEVKELNNYRYKSLKTCNVQISGLGYLMLGLNGVISIDEAKNKPETIQYLKHLKE